MKYTLFTLLYVCSIGLNYFISLFVRVMNDAYSES